MFVETYSYLSVLQCGFQWNLIYSIKMKVEKNRVVAVNYTLEVESKIADRSQEGSPLEYIHGSGMLLPKFEQALEGKEPTESFDFTLSPEDGYGVYNEEYKIDLPIDSFKVDGKLRDDLLVIGRMLPMYNSDGQIIQGTVAAVTTTAVTMDFNHPMAGKTLHFSGTIDSVREATEKELKEGLHGEYLPKEGCHCGKDCKGGCEGGCDCGEGDCNCSEGGCDCE